VEWLDIQERSGNPLIQKVNPQLEPILVQGPNWSLALAIVCRLALPILLSTLNPPPIKAWEHLK
jgi:hypothetical protein